VGINPSRLNVCRCCSEVINFNLLVRTGSIGKVEVSPEVRSSIASACADHTKFRKAMGYKGKSADLAWKAGWPASADALLSLVEDHLVHETMSES